MTTAPLVTCAKLIIDAMRGASMAGQRHEDGPCRPRWRTGLLCPSRQCGQIRLSVSGVYPIIAKSRQADPVRDRCAVIRGRKGIRVIRPKPQSIDILIFSVCLRGGPGVAIRSSCYRQKNILATRAKFYRQHRIHLDEAGNHGIGVVTAGTLVADDGETPIGSLFVVDAEDRTRSRVVCAKCGSRGNKIDVRPNWKEQPARPTALRQD
ncbi:MAG: hypothetical protein WBL84_08050 [Xanthobacteraceae bacterium]